MQFESASVCYFVCGKGNDEGGTAMKEDIWCVRSGTMPTRNKVLAWVSGANKWSGNKVAMCITFRPTNGTEINYPWLCDRGQEVSTLEDNLDKIKQFFNTDEGVREFGV
jgi:hypothetical protein